MYLTEEPGKLEEEEKHRFLYYRPFLSAAKKFAMLLQPRVNVFIAAKDTLIMIKAREIHSQLIDDLK